MKSLSGQFKVKGRRLRNGQVQIRFLTEGIPPSVATWLQAQFEQPQVTMLSRFSKLAKDAPQNSLLDELKERGYDLATFEFEISLKEAGHWRPKQLRSPVPQLGRLYARWGRMAYDSTGDIVTAWGAPARRADSHRFHAWLSMFLVEDHQGPLPTNSPIQLLEEFKRLGFDVRTLKFSVRTQKTEQTASDLVNEPEAPDL